MNSFKNNCSTFCPLPWVQLSTYNDTAVRLCCNTNPAHIRRDDDKIVYLDEVDTIEELLNFKTYKDTRAQKIKGQQPSICHTCFNVEKFGGRSIRESYLDQYKDIADELIDGTKEDGSIEPHNIKLYEIDFSLSNICTLKCRMCNPFNSSALRNEFDALKFEYSREDADRASNNWKFEKALKNIFEKYSDNLKRILTTGGEPFISKIHIECLESLIASGLSQNVSLMYHSSLNYLPERLLELWKHFKFVDIHLSLEGVGSMNEYARYPAKWNDILKNIDKLYEKKNEIRIRFEVHSCVQAMTWPRHFELIEFLAEVRIKWPEVHRFPYPIWIDDPPELTIHALPVELRELGINRLKEAFFNNFNLDVENLTLHEKHLYELYLALFDRMESSPQNPQLFLKFKERINAVDNYRKQSLIEIVPEFKPYFN